MVIKMLFDHLSSQIMSNQKDILVLKIKSPKAFHTWLSKNHDKQSECYLNVKKGRPIDKKMFYYLDAVEVALCFGWIDSSQKVIDGIRYQRFSPRRKNSPWTELNKERVRRLEKLGLMTDAGRKVLPDMDTSHFKIDTDIVNALKKKKAWEKFNEFPDLYKRIRAYNISFYKKLNPDTYKKSLNRFIDQTLLGKMYGEWNDYGRLLDY